MIKYPVIGLTSRRPTVSQEKTEKAQIIWLAWTGKHRSLCYMFQNTKQSPWFPEGKKVDHFWHCSLVLSDHSDSVVSKNKQQRDWTLRRLQWHSSIFWKYNVVTNLLIYCDGTVLASDLWGHHTCDVAHALLSRNAPGPHKHREEASVSPLFDTVRSTALSKVTQWPVQGRGNQNLVVCPSCVWELCPQGSSTYLLPWREKIHQPSLLSVILMYTWHNKAKTLWEIC